jgi:hypothetical protein
VDAPPIILALDIATRTGWATGDGSALPEHGWWDLPPAQDGDRGRLFTAFRKNLIALIGEAEPFREVVVIFEQPILPKPFMKNGVLIFPTSIEVTLVLQGLAAIAEQVCDEAGVSCEMVDVSTVKLGFAGSGKATKEDMERVARRMGFTITHDDEADAIAVWACALREYNRKRAEWFDGLIYGAGRGGLL